MESGPTRPWWQMRCRCASSLSSRGWVRCSPASSQQEIQTRMIKKSTSLVARAAAAAAVAIGLAAALHGTHALAQQAPEKPALPAGPPIKNARYIIDPTHTFVNYEMGHYGTTTNRGRFSTKDGVVRMDDTGQNGKIDITMDMSSINTGVDLLNRHVQSKDFLNVADFPTGRFVADKIIVAS